MSTGDKTGRLRPKKRRFTLFIQRFGFTKQTVEMERKYVTKERGEFMNDEKPQLGGLSNATKQSIMY